MEAKAAAVVSMHIQERLEDKLWQSAFSLPRWVSTEDIIDATELNFLCEVRRCFAVCGRMHFQRFIREEIASGISIEIFSRPVREHECDPSASSWQDPYVPRMVRATSGRSLMQRAARQSRVASSAVVDPSAGVQDVTHPRLEAPAVTLRDLWQHHFAQCRDHDTDLLMVETWYLDHLRRPWSNEVRLTQLGSDFRAWEPRLRRAWTDWFIASRPVEFHVVVPDSLDPAHGVHFQILLVQQPQPMRRAVLLAIHDETLAQVRIGRINCSRPLFSSRGFQKAFSCIRALMRHSLSLIVFVNLTLRTKQCCSSMGLPMMELQHGALCACSLTPRAPRRFWVPLLT